MTDDRCRITVIGDTKQASVAVPAWAPVGEYVSKLTQLCGMPSSATLPAAWSLAPAGSRPVPLGTSLAEAGIVDGQRLYLRDLADGEMDEPVVEDVSEIVSDLNARRGRLHGVARAAVAAALGVAWLLAVASYLVWGDVDHGRDGSAASCLLGVGLLLPVAVWVLGPRPDKVPRLVRLPVALTAIPCLAAAAVLLVRSAGSGQRLSEAALLGAALGALTALAAIPDAVTLAMQLLLALAAVTGAVVTALHLSPVPCAAVAAIMTLIVLALAPWASAVLAGMSFGAPPTPEWSPESVSEMVARARMLLGLLTIVPLLALATAEVLLASSSSLFALALPAVIGVALLVKAADSAFTVQAVPIGVAGLFGLFAALAGLDAHMSAHGWLAPALVGLGVLTVGGGVAGAIVVAVRPPANGPEIGPDLDHHTWSEVLGLICNLATVPLVLGVFGLFGHLARLGGKV